MNSLQVSDPSLTRGHVKCSCANCSSNRKVLNELGTGDSLCWSRDVHVVGFDGTGEGMDRYRAPQSPLAGDGAVPNAQETASRYCN